MTAGQRQWIGIALASVCVLLAVALLFRPPPPAPRPAGLSSAAIGLAQIDSHAPDSLLKEEAIFYDPTPLFLPTVWNSAPKEVDPLRHESGAAFAPYGPKLAFADDALRLDFPAPISVPERPADALAEEAPDHPFLGFGRSDAPPPALPSRRAFVEVTDMATGRRVFARALQGAEIPPSAGGWEPLEFAAAVEPAGLVGPLVLTAGSGSAQVDAFFQRVLARDLRVGERLNPGFYRIGVGP